MTTIQPDKLYWSADSADFLRVFLASPHGQMFLARIDHNRPAATAGPTVEIAALRGAEVTGYEKCVSVLLSMLRGDPPPQTPDSNPNTAYPALNDEAAWKALDEQTK